MKKMKLEVEALEVESFVVDGVGASIGTVRARESGDFQFCGMTIEKSCDAGGGCSGGTCLGQNSCYDADTCNPVVGTCAQTCYIRAQYSCANQLTCGGETCGGVLDGCISYSNWGTCPQCTPYPNTQ